MLRAVVAEHGEREMAFEELGGPDFPLGEEALDLAAVFGAASAAKELAGGGRRAGAGIEQRDRLLAVREGLEQDGQITDDDRHEAEAAAGLEDSDELAGVGDGSDVAIAEREKGFAAVVEVLAEVVAGFDGQSVAAPNR